MINIIGDQGKSKYNRDLARIVNAEAEKEKERQELMKKMRGEKTPEPRTGPSWDIEDKYPEPIKTMMKNYRRFMKGEEYCFSTLPMALMEGLKPCRKEIEWFTRTICFYKQFQYITGRGSFMLDTGHYLSALMMASGEENFEFNFTGENKNDIFLHNFGILLEGKNVFIKGDVGNGLGQLAKKCYFYVDGDVGDELGRNSKNCHYKIDGKSGTNVGDHAEKCVIELNGLHKGLGYNRKDTIILQLGRPIEK